MRNAAGLSSSFCSFACSPCSSLYFLLDPDRFQFRQLAQADFEDIFGLAFAELECFDEIDFWVVRLSDDADDLVDVEQYQGTAFEHMQPVEHPLQTMSTATAQRFHPELDPLVEDLQQRLLTRSPVAPDRPLSLPEIALQAGVRQQQLRECLPILCA